MALKANGWFENLGTNPFDRGNPVFSRASLGSRGTDTVLGGHTPVTADDLDAAIALAKDRPARQYGDGVEVGEHTQSRDTRLIDGDRA